MRCKKVSEVFLSLFVIPRRGDETEVPGRVDVSPAEKDADSFAPDGLLHLPGNLFQIGNCILQTNALQAFVQYLVIS